jgi:hypothetical protein
MSKREVIEGALHGILEDQGELVPRHVVDVARDTAHPLHQCFNWDDTEAAEKYRIGQAAQLIRTIKITIVTDSETFKVRAYHAYRNIGQDRPGYVPDAMVQALPEAKTILLQSMRRDWVTYKRRYGHLSEFWDMVRTEEPAPTEEPVAV